MRVYNILTNQTAHAHILLKALTPPPPQTLLFAFDIPRKAFALGFFRKKPPLTNHAVFESLGCETSFFCAVGRLRTPAVPQGRKRFASGVAPRLQNNDREKFVSEQLV